MMKLLCVICIVMTTLPAVCQPASAYQVGTIMDVKPHAAAANKVADVATYDVSLRVNDTMYVVVYTDTFGTGTVKYTAGREVLVLVGAKTVTYNDIMGRTVESPILSQKPVAKGKQASGG